MDARVLLGGLSVGLAFASAALLASGVRSVVPRRRDAADMARGADAPRAGRLAWRLRNGFAVASPIAERLLASARVRRFAGGAVQLLAERRYVTTERALLSCMVAACVVLGAVAFAATGSVVGAVAIVACALAGAAGLARAAADPPGDSERDAVPDVLRSMDGPLRSLFAHGAHVLDTGGSATEALGGLRQGSGASELAFVAVALDVQHQTGGSMRQVLDAARDSVEGELALRRSLKVQTAQAKLSAQVVSVMPFALVAVFSLVSEDFLSPFFASPAGWALLGLALGMQAAGVGMVRRVLAVGSAS